MGAEIIDGKTFAENLRTAMTVEVAALPFKPGLAVVLVGNDPAFRVYVANKAKQTVQVGMRSFEHRLPGDTTQEDLLSLVRQLNADPAVHGILVQLRCPSI